MCNGIFAVVTIHGYSKHHAKNLPAKLSGLRSASVRAKQASQALSTAAKQAAIVLLMLFRTACTLIPENNQSLMCKHNESDFFLKLAVNSNMLLHGIQRMEI